jgi:hypothetical protein
MTFFLSLKNDVNVISKSNKQKTYKISSIRNTAGYIKKNATPDS